MDPYTTWSGKFWTQTLWVYSPASEDPENPAPAPLPNAPASVIGARGAPYPWVMGMCPGRVRHRSSQALMEG